MTNPETWFCPFCANPFAHIEDTGTVREHNTDAKLDIVHCIPCDTWFFLSQHKESRYVQGYYEECYP